MKVDRKFIERLATYLIGVAIGLVLVGFIQMQRSNARQAQQVQQAQPNESQPTGESLPLPGSDP